jgi:hypothetical protein
MAGHEAVLAGPGGAVSWQRLLRPETAILDSPLNGEHRVDTESFAEFPMTPFEFRTCPRTAIYGIETELTITQRLAGHLHLLR